MSSTTPALPRERPPSPRAILFTDIVGSTLFFATRGDRAGLQMLDRHNSALFPIVEQANGRIVKTIGDSIFAVFEAAPDALRAAFALQQRLAELRAALPEDEHIHIRVGVHYGLVTEKDNDVFGDAVNLGERVKSHAGADQVFVSRTLRDLVRAAPRFVMRSVGPHELKGLSEPMELFELSDAPPVFAPSFAFRWLGRASRLLRRHPLPITLAAMAVVALALGLSMSRRPAEAPPSEPRALAVLPFRNLARDPALDHLSEALPEQLNLQFRADDSLVLRPISCVRRYKDRNWDPREVGAELKAGTLVAGSFLPEGEQLRVTVEVIDARENRQLLAQPILGQVNNILDLVLRTARRLAEALRLQLAADEGAARLGTQNRQAFDIYLRALVLHSVLSRENIAEVIHLLKQAIELDPNFARAHALLAEAYTSNYWWNYSYDRKWLERAEAEANRALELQPDLPEAHFALAYALEAQGRRAESLRAIQRSFRADRRNVKALTYLARYSFYMGEYDLALGVLDRIALIDPTQNIHVRKGIYLFFAGRPALSHQELRQAEQKAQGDDELTFIGYSYAWVGDLEATERVLARLQTNNAPAVNQAEVRAWILTARGHYGEAQKEMRVFERDDWGVAQELAALYALQGERAKALEWMERAADLGGPSYAWFVSDHFRSLRDQPRYQAVVEKLDAEYRPLRPEFARLLAETPF